MRRSRRMSASASAKVPRCAVLSLPGFRVPDATVVGVAAWCPPPPQPAATRASTTTASAATADLVVPDNVDGDLHRPNRAAVLEPVDGLAVLGPAQPRPVVRGDAVPVVGDRPFADVDHPRPVDVVVHRAEDTAGLDRDHPHPKLAAGHAFDLRPEVDRAEHLGRDPLRLWCRVSAHCFLSIGRTSAHDRTPSRGARPGCRRTAPALTTTTRSDMIGHSTAAG